jgi:hypothetical protein
VCYVTWLLAPSGACWAADRRIPKPLFEAPVGLAHSGATEARPPVPPGLGTVRARLPALWWTSRAERGVSGISLGAASDRCASAAARETEGAVCGVRRLDARPLLSDFL